MKQEARELVDGMINAANNIDLDTINKDQHLGYIVNVAIPMVDSTFQKLIKAIEKLELDKVELTVALGAAIRDRSYWAQKALFKDKSQ